ncbi:MAG: methyltransferase, partial [Ferruginibacter sp.]
MPNSFFRFKQFTVHQDQCSMKVCTDACVFGAHVAAHIEKGMLPINLVLDIGTGTGLLSLLLAQKNSAVIDAIEIDKDAATQSKENFSDSPWSHRLHVYNKDAKQFHPGKKYDCIITNPPFFEDDLHSPDERKNTAKHDLTLNFDQLLKVIDDHLSAEGFFAVLLPAQRAEDFIQVAEKQPFYLKEKVLFQHTVNHAWFRTILYFTRKKTEDIIEEEL